ncbi:HEAT repeat domain-containing protein [Povalibacter sp.]|uniref:HEAT repeat domain-containing protein n=1 Tax=Povalibacter sp. TaxID=1962978 RepID=UPI002F404927
MKNENDADVNQATERDTVEAEKKMQQEAQARQLRQEKEQKEKERLEQEKQQEKERLARERLKGDGQQDRGSPRWVAIAGFVVGLPLVAFTIVQLSDRLRNPPGIQIIEASVQSLDRPTLKIQLRNATDAPALLTKAELVFDSVKTAKADSQASTEVRPARYTWIVTPADVERGSSQRRLSVRVEGKAPDALEFVLGFETRHSQLDGRAHVRLYYDDGKQVQSKPFDVRIVNGPGDFPELSFPASDSGLTALLDSTDSPFMLRQIIGELARRQFAPAATRVENFFSHADVTVRAAAAEYFIEVRDPGAAPGLAILVEQDSAQTRRAALKALAALGADAASDVERLAQSKDPAVREAALNLCGDLPGEPCLQLVRDALDDRAVAKSVGGSDVLVAATALRVLAGMGATADADRIVAFLADPDPGMQIAAIDAVRVLRLRQALPKLRQLASSGSAAVKDAAGKAVAALRS